MAVRTGDKLRSVIDIVQLDVEYNAVSSVTRSNGRRNLRDMQAALIFALRINANHIIIPRPGFCNTSF